MCIDLKLSVIVPVHNGTKYINCFKAALDKQTIKSDSFEVIFIDNLSTDESFDSLSKKYSEYKNVKVIKYHQKPSSYAARNEGVKLARSETLAFIDIDCIPEADWLSNIVQSFGDFTESKLISGQVFLFYKNKVPNVFELFDQHYFLNQDAYAIEKSGATANLTVSKSLFQGVGGFRDVESGGDRDFCKRVVVENNSCFEFNNTIVVRHPARCTIDEIMKKIKRVSTGKVNLAQDKPLFFKLKTLGKNLLGLIAQRKQFVEIKNVLTTADYNYPLKIKFIYFSLFFGFYARFVMVKGLLKGLSTGKV
ncbi:glycosyltransferase family A protein [Psychrosphaera aquimarina]|uniref:Glycosyltransferase family A protein n=1 Tax=Psychrosphaera aquimarina TaxID=2044854 RepID=A0ABU3R4H2_9GAMM|nr:glycosyltransferase family A protein [Psychrosphaera aquimarina]MDU0114571.1 glycosyltransferase family A protein [Psychrosphaera aquimarina]